MKNLPNKFYIAGYAWMIVSLLTTKPALSLSALVMMTFCFIVSWLTD